MKTLSRAAGLCIGLPLVFVAAQAHATVTTYSLPGQAGVLRLPTADASAWTNSYGRMTHEDTNNNTSELDFPFTAIAGSTQVQGFANVDVAAPYTVTIFGPNVTPRACAQTLAIDPSGTSIMTTPVVCEAGPAGGVTGYALTTASLSPLSQFYSYLALWATAGVTVNSVSYALTK